MLAPGGRLLLSVPYWNGMRKLGTPHLIRQGRKLRASGGEFYQFAFSRREMRRFLEAHGFRVLSFQPYDPARMLRPTIRWLGEIARPAEPRSAAANRTPAGSRPPRRSPALRRIAYSGLVLRMFAHMILAVAVRP